MPSILWYDGCYSNLNISMKNLPTSKFLKWALGAGITSLLALFFVVSTQLVLEKPQYDDFCENPQVRIIPQTQEECLVVGGQWTDDKYIQKRLPTRFSNDAPVIEIESEGYCDIDFTCREEYGDATKLYERNFFVSLVVLGTATLIASFLVHSLVVVAPALSAGGVLTLFVASVRYWSEMEDYLRVIVLAIALAALIWVGIKKFKPEAEQDPRI